MPVNNLKTESSCIDGAPACVDTRDSFPVVPRFFCSLVFRGMQLEIREENDDLDLDVSVQYYQVPNEDFGALIRRTTLTNTHDSETLEIEVHTRVC